MRSRQGHSKHLCSTAAVRFNGAGKWSYSHRQNYKKQQVDDASHATKQYLELVTRAEIFNTII
jgi:hypothetical protein